MSHPLRDKKEGPTVSNGGVRLHGTEARLVASLMAKWSACDGKTWSRADVLRECLRRIARAEGA